MLCTTPKLFELIINRQLHLINLLPTTITQATLHITKSKNDDIWPSIDEYNFCTASTGIQMAANNTQLCTAHISAGIKLPSIYS
jgi:hypothetical protein